MDAFNKISITHCQKLGDMFVDGGMCEELAEVFVRDFDALVSAVCIHQCAHAYQSHALLPQVNILYFHP